MPESTSITPALDPTYIRRSPRCLLMLYNQFNVIADVLQARQEVIVEALEIMAEKQNRKNYREWSLKWRDYLMATFEEADESENNLKELLESWDEEKVAQAYMVKDMGGENQEASGKSDKVRNEKTGKCKRAEDGAEEEEQEDGRRAEGEEQEDERRAEEEEQEEAGEGNKKRMGRRSRRKIIIEDESEDLEEDEAGVDLEGSILLE